jgi:RNA polymerase sigma-32 factor
MTANLPVVSDSLELYLREIRKFPVLTRDQEYDLARRLKDHQEITAAHQLITANLRFVVKIATEYKHYGLKLADLIQEGNIGLMRAVKRFDPDKGYRLISYAVWWIKASIQNFILSSWSLVKIGTTQAQRKLFYKLRSAKNALEIRDGGSQGDHVRQLAEDLEVPEYEIQDMELRTAFRDFSLDSSLDGDLTHTPLETLADENKNQEDLIIEKEQETLLSQSVTEIRGMLNKKEQFVLKHRLMEEEPMTLQEIGDHFKISRERVRQIEHATKRKIRVYLEEKIQNRQDFALATA